MFTGLVREIGTVEEIGSRSGVTALGISAPRTADQLAIGSSLAVNGICLTVTSLTGARVSVDASVETRRVTTLCRWRVGDRVHLEPSLRIGDEVGGHFVLGHVDGTGRVVRLERSHGVVRMTVRVPARLTTQLLPKGSIAVDGVSLTLDAGPFRGQFTVTLVPHTLRATRFDELRVADEVNIEVDVLAKAASQPQLAQLTMRSILDKGWQW
ncbi:MAG TPA: riboflavin synthase [Vicinamibacterales bacterium]|jgi:riboflavin synthase